jgi:hypothetical protein
MMKTQTKVTMLDLEHNQQIIEDRDRDIRKIRADVEDVNQLFKDIDEMVLAQGVLLRKFYFCSYLLM